MNLAFEEQKDEFRKPAASVAIATVRSIYAHTKVFMLPLVRVFILMETFMQPETFLVEKPCQVS